MWAPQHFCSQSAVSTNYGGGEIVSLKKHNFLSTLAIHKHWDGVFVNKDEAFLKKVVWTVKRWHMFSHVMHIVPINIYGYSGIVVPAIYFHSVAKDVLL